MVWEGQRWEGWLHVLCGDTIRAYKKKKKKKNTILNPSLPQVNYLITESTKNKHSSKDIQTTSCSTVWGKWKTNAPTLLIFGVSPRFRYSARMPSIETTIKVGSKSWVPLERILGDRGNVCSILGLHTIPLALACLVSLPNLNRCPRWETGADPRYQTI